MEASIYGTKVDDAAEIWHINTNNGRLFKGRYALPTDERVRGSVMRDGNGTFLFDKIDGDREIALGSKKATEMICLRVKKEIPNVNLNIHSGHRAAILASFYSAATLIQRCLADKLDVEPDEIEISLRTDQQTGIPMIYLSDALPNGANLVGHLFEDNNLELLLKSISDGTNAFIRSLTSYQHMANCKTSCHACLNTYSNRGLHHVLDWRLGIGIIRIMLGQPYDFGMTQNDSTYFELKDKDSIESICATRLGMPSGKTTDAIMRGVISSRRSIWHPLWDTSSAGKFLPAGKVELFDTFSVMRTDLTGMGFINVADLSTYESQNNNRVDPETNITLDVEL